MQLEQPLPSKYFVFDKQNHAKIRVLNTYSPLVFYFKVFSLIVFQCSINIIRSTSTRLFLFASYTIRFLCLNVSCHVSLTY